jgi:iron complex outermembrane receptor protein
VPISAPTNPFSSTWTDQGAPANGSAGYIVTIHDRNPSYPRLSQQDSTLFRVVGGLRGEINENYSWEAAANLNRYELNFVNPGVVSTANWNAAAASGAINPFAYTQPAGVLPGNIIGSAFDNMLSTLNSFDFKFTGTPFDLPAGKLGFAIGASFAREALSAAPDANSIPDANGNIGWLFGVSLQPFHAHRKVNAAYVEIEAPIFAPAQNIPGLHMLNLDLAGRYEDYTQVGSSSVPKASLKYQPIDDQFSLRASVGKSFSAPLLYDLFGPIATGSTNSITFNNYNSSGQPTGQQTALVQFQSQSGANPKLKPSTATTWTTGLVFTPKQLKGLTLSLDYFQTVQKDLVGNYDQIVVTQSVEKLGPASPYASVVHFGSITGRGVTAPGQLSTANPSSVYLNLPYINIASQAIKGWDATVEYAFDVAALGKFDFSTTLTGYNSYMAQALPTEDYYQYAGHASGNGSVSQGTIPRWRAYTVLSWKQAGFTYLIAHTYIPSVTDIGAGGSAAAVPVGVETYQQYDASVAYEFSHLSKNRWLSNLDVRVGVNNAFNRMPPLAKAAFPNTNADVGTYGGPIGRMYYVDLTYKF